MTGRKYGVGRVKNPIIYTSIAPYLPYLYYSI